MAGNLVFLLAGVLPLVLAAMKLIFGKEEAGPDRASWPWVQEERAQRPLLFSCKSSAAAMALPMSVVLALPPRSGVTGPCSTTFRIARRIEAAA